MNYFGKNMVNRYEQVEVSLFLECGEETYNHWLTGRWYPNLIIVPEQGEAVAMCISELNEALCDDPTATSVW